MKHFRERNVVNVQRLASDFLAAFLARNGFADRMMICICAHSEDVLYNLLLLLTQVKRVNPICSWLALETLRQKNRSLVPMSGKPRRRGRTKQAGPRESSPILSLACMM